MVTPSYLAAPARLARSPEAPSTGSPLPPMGLRQHEMQRLLADRRARALSQLPPQAPTLLLSSPPGTLPACSGPAEFQPRKSLTPFSRICGQQCSRASPSLPIPPPPPRRPGRVRTGGRHPGSAGLTNTTICSSLSWSLSFSSWMWARMDPSRSRPAAGWFPALFPGQTDPDLYWDRDSPVRNSCSLSSPVFEAGR